MNEQTMLRRGVIEPRKLREIIALALFGIAAVSMNLRCSKGPAGSSANSPKKGGVAVRIAVARHLDLLDSGAFSAPLEASRTAALGPMQPGRVSRLLVNVGDRVQEGQILAVMDDGQLVMAAAQFQPVKARYDRAMRLYANKAMPKAEFEQIEAQYVSMKRQVDQIQENTAIKAPFSGVVTGRSAEEGEIYSPRLASGRTPGLIELAQLEKLMINLSVDARTVAQLHKGQHVDFKVDALPDSLFSGSVEWINPSADPVSRMFEVRISVSNARGTLRAGYEAQVTVPAEGKKAAMVIPEDAVVDNQVFVVRNGIALRHQVRVGWKKPGRVEILAGLGEGDTVVVSGNRALPDSAAVHVVTE